MTRFVVTWACLIAIAFWMFPLVDAAVRRDGGSFYNSIWAIVTLLVVIWSVHIKEGE